MSGPTLQFGGHVSSASHVPWIQPDSLLGCQQVCEKLNVVDQGHRRDRQDDQARAVHCLLDVLGDDPGLAEAFDDA